MKFFVPETSKEEFEIVYKQLAEAANSKVPSLEDRVYSIEFSSNGEKWLATVGEKLTGEKKHKKVNAFPEKISDGATVLAIFRSSSHMVVTNKGITQNVRSNWENPFMAGQPTKVVKFSQIR